MGLIPGSSMYSPVPEEEEEKERRRKKRREKSKRRIFIMKCCVISTYMFRVFLKRQAITKGYTQH